MLATAKTGIPQFQLRSAKAPAMTSVANIRRRIVIGFRIQQVTAARSESRWLSAGGFNQIHPKWQIPLRVSCR